MPVPEGQKVTEDQASTALFQLTHPEEPAAAPKVIPEAEKPAAEEAVVEDAPAEAAEATEEAPQDDVESLRKRLAEAEERQKRIEEDAQARAEAMQRRFAENERVLRERFLRKSTVTDKLLKTLEKAKTEDGVDPAEVERLITEARSTMNPASSSFTPVEQPVTATEDQAIVLNNFLNERRMTQKDADEFGAWMRTDANTALSPMEQAIAGRDLDAFLRIAHDRFATAKTEAERQRQRGDAAAAVRSVQKTQKEAAKAAATVAASPKKQPVGVSKEVDVKKLTKEDVSSLIRQTWQQYQ